MSSKTLPANGRPLRAWAPAAAMAALALVLGYAAATGQASLFTLAAAPLLLAATVLFFVLLRPAPVIWVFMVGLPLHTFAQMVLYGGLGVPGGVIEVLSVWKELLALGAAGVFAARIWTRPLLQGRLYLTRTDKWIAVFSVWVVLRLVLSRVLDTGVPLGIEVYGLRFYLLPVVLYVLGRTIQLRSRLLTRMLLALAVLGGLSGLIAVIERLLPDSTFLALLRQLGYQEYFLEYVRADGFYGPDQTAASMWIPVGGRFVRRAGSIYMVSKPFAFTYLLILPIVTALLLAARSARARLLLWLCMGLCWAGLLVSLTRAVIVVGFALTVLMYFMTRRWSTAVLVAYAALLVGVCALFVPSIQEYIGRTISGTDASASQHLRGWLTGLASSGDSLLAGSGVGTANQELHRFRGQLSFTLPPISESIYVQTLQELGLAGLALYLGGQFSIIRSANRIRKRPERDLAALGFSMQWATIGILLAGFVALPWQGSFVLTYFFWLLAGLLERASTPARNGEQG